MKIKHQKLKKNCVRSVCKNDEDERQKRDEKNERGFFKILKF